jgi:uncharacterized damage-inducible protein DinB
VPEYFPAITGWYEPMNASILTRLSKQLDCLPEVLGSASPDAVHNRPASGKWSAHENLAHLVRVQEIMLSRMERILGEDSPRLDRYDAQSDPDWPSRAALSTDRVLDQLLATRARLIAKVEQLSPEEWGRIGVHGRMGAMPLGTWLEFFLVHEAHHLYMVFLRSRGA